ncbi:MAG: hypothetical protein RLZZ312_1837 [Bacteroidota bacterium]|jgi:aldehyde dehydrogenase (NAD+)
MNFKTDIQYRKSTLKKLLDNIVKYENEVIDALYKDFKKPAFEAVLTETNYVISDLKDTLKNIESWSKPRRVLPSILNFPSSDYIYSEPYGNVLILSPWNYPFQLTMCPLISAIAAGNKVTVKPSENAPNTASIVAKIIRDTFETNHAVAILGDSTLASKLLDQRWDYIFFTGSVAIGKIVATAAATNLTPVTLELGGKNPCIVDKTANLKLAAKRIVWGKFLNAGQTCIAPDYILVEESEIFTLTCHLIDELIAAYDVNAQVSPDYARIINKQHWIRLTKMLENAQIVHGGESSEVDNYIAPTLVEVTDLSDPLMKDEIFGPILPILTYKTNADLHKIISSLEKPLALYVFTNNNDFAESIIKNFSFGGGCINDTVIHFSNKRLPFGGVGHSGIGAYHGKKSFDVFSHNKSIVKKANWLDLPMRYAPYGNKLKWIRRILKFI